MAISKCWERQVDRRTQTVEDLAADLAPFASRDAALSLERLRRSSDPRSSQGADSHETLMAPDTMGALRERTATPPGGPSAYPETGRAWLKSGTSDALRSKASPALRIGVAGGVVALVLAGAVAFFARGPATVPSAANVTQAPPPSTATVQPAALAPPPVATRLEPVGLAPPPPFATQPSVEGHPDAGAAAPSRATPKDVPAPPRARPTAKPASDPTLDDLLDRRQ